MTQPEYFPLLTAKYDYAPALIESIEQATDRVLLETMVLDDHGAMADVFEALAWASQRGVNVSVIYDRYSDTTNSIGKTHYELNSWQVRLGQLAATGAYIQKVGKSRLNPFAGRHHAKVAIVDDTTYIGGGVNLTGGSFTNHDYMIRFNNQKMSNALYNKLPDIATRRNSDEILYSDDKTEILIDAGTPGESIIYDLTCDLAEEANKIHYISKLAPDGDLLDIMKRKNTYYWHNTVSSASGFDKLAIFLDQLKFRAANNYNGQDMIHAKACLFEMPDGSRHVITGSHNFNSRGVKFGTQEIAIHSTDDKIYQSILDFARSL